MSSLTMNVENAAHSDAHIVSEVIRYYEKGAEILFSRSHTGEAKIKVRHGPLKLFVTRYTVNDKTAVAIKDNMRARSHRS